MSLFRKHMEKIAAAQSHDDSGLRKDLSEYEMMLVRLHDDVLRIKSAQSTDRKNAIKREIFPEYLPWIEGVIESVSASDSEHYRQDDVFTQSFVWAVDVLDLALAERMFVVINKAGMSLPDRFKRQPANFMLEQFADSVIKEKNIIDIDALQRIDDITQNIDIHDEVRAKWHKAQGLLLESRDDIDSLELAIEHFQTATKLNSKSGVATRLKKLIKLVDEKKASPSPPPQK